MRGAKDKKKRKISEVPEAVGKPWSQSIKKESRVYGGNDLWKKNRFKMRVKDRVSYR